MPRLSRQTSPSDGLDSSPPLHMRLFVTFKDDLQAALLEFIGTTTFLTLAFGSVQATTSEQASVGMSSGTGIDSILYISFAFGFSLLVSAWLFFRVTGGLFNPNVTTALLLCGIIEPVRFVLFCVAQLVGGIAAAALVLALTPGDLASNAVLAPGINPAQGVFIEAFTTACLCLAVLMLAAEKHVATPFAPVGIGLTLFCCELFAVYYTGGAVNTARAFGPAVVTGFPNGTHWVYWVGPFIGSLIATIIYAALKHYRYWTLNPGQDTVNFRESPPDPVNAIRRSRSLRSLRSSRRSRSNGRGQQEAKGREGPNEIHENGYKPNDSPV